MANVNQTFLTGSNQEPRSKLAHGDTHTYGENNVVAGTMSRLETKELNWLEEGTKYLHAIAKGSADLKKQANRQLEKKVPNLITLTDYCGTGTIKDDVHPLQFTLIQAGQQKDSSANEQLKDFLGGRKK
eukprot:8343943-Ditylum_brightwellii.AAC.1